MRLRKIIVERELQFVKFRVDNRGSNGTSCFRIKVRTDAAELTNMRIPQINNLFMEKTGPNMPRTMLLNNMEVHEQG